MTLRVTVAVEENSIYKARVYPQTIATVLVNGERKKLHWDQPADILEAGQTRDYHLHGGQRIVVEELINP